MLLLEVTVSFYGYWDARANLVQVMDGRPFLVQVFTPDGNGIRLQATRTRHTAIQVTVRL